MKLKSMIPNEVKVGFKNETHNFSFLKHHNIYRFIGINEAFDNTLSIQGFKTPNIPRNAIHGEPCEREEHAIGTSLDEGVA